MTLQDKLDIIQYNFNLNIEEVETSVYKILNPEQEVDIHELGYKLEECILITSDQLNTKRPLIAHMYYIILDYNNDTLKYKYHKQANAKFKDAVIDSYSKSEEELSSERIDTMYDIGVEYHIK